MKNLISSHYGEYQGDVQGPQNKTYVNWNYQLNMLPSPSFTARPWKVAQKQQGSSLPTTNFQGLFLLNFRGCKLFNRKLYDHQVCQARGSYACGSLFPSDWPCLTRIIRRGLSRSLSFIFLRFKVGNSSCHQETWGFTCLQDELASFFQL